VANITIGNGVTNFGAYAFVFCNSLTSVTIGNGVTSIGDYAFQYCTSLTSIAIPGSVTSIGDGTFESCFSLTSVTIGNGVISIGGYAFNSCNNLTNIAIPDSLTSIGDGTFASCASLTAITVEALNPVYRSVEGVLFNKSQPTLIQCPGGKAGSYTIPNGITSIGANAFNSCNSRPVSSSPRASLASELKRLIPAPT
jgi:hypothetical protein